MCGICGIFHKGKLEISPEKIIRMRDYMVERGPDTAGYRILPNIALGHRRLKIIDLSERGDQPMSNETGSIWIVYNGEIYNFNILREELIRCGHQFKSKTDTEVIIHGYEQWGLNVFKKILGMFAIAIYDSQKEQLILARDRVGKKPLFYAVDSNIVYFASDIKSIYYTFPRNLEIDINALDCYLHHIAVPEQHSIYKGIKKIYPGTYTVFTMDSQVVHTYWEWDYSQKTDSSEEEILQTSEKYIIDAILKRTISDVPIGVMLSGGVDSSIITAILSQNSSEKIKTFTIGFKDYPRDDIIYAREVAKFYSTDHTEIILDYDVSKYLIDLIWFYGEPFADSSALPTYYVSKAAKDHITVMLTGDGGDEAFGGYGRTISALNAEIFSKWLPKFLHPASKNILEHFNVNPESSSLSGKMLYYINYLEGFPNKSFYNTMGFHKYRSQIWSPHILQQLKNHNPLHPFIENFKKVKNLNPIDQVLFVDGRTRLMYDYLVKVDRATMANSVEARSPFLDTELLDYSATIPPLIKFNKRKTKYLLKKIGEKYLPKKLLYREKQGFGVPVDRWIKKDIADTFEKVLFNKWSQERGYFNVNFIQQMWNEHKLDIINHKHRLWSLFWFELWHLMFIDKVISKDTPFSEIKNILNK
ncbi:MAG TPA: asparagine synthase (glutamine-hydrolyzing) [Candidatus Marinimicrobia bacterium]|nr:asparagine synthase (glutamine-hydrolyzing) [Candidatus Neomarinimicrobiota bacterium]